MSATIQHLPYAIDESRNRHHFYENHWKRTGLALLMRHCPPQGQTVLDYGCGRGEFLEMAGAAGYRVTGADVDPQCVALSRQKGEAVLMQPGDPLPQFGPRSFDIVSCFHVLEHVDNPRLVLKGLRDMARQYLILAVPNLRNLVWLFHRQIRLDYVNEGHLQSWDHYHFLNLAERHCGLELVAWGFDATALPLLSHWSGKMLGVKTQIRLETGLFKRLFPFHGISVLGLFRPRS